MAMAVSMVVAMAILLPLQALQAAEIRVVGTYFGVQGILNPRTKNEQTGKIFNCLFAPLGQDIVFQGHSRDRINILRDKGQIDVIFPSGKFSSWNSQDTLWIGPTHHIELSWFKLENHEGDDLFTADIPKSAPIGVERNSYSEKWLRRNGYTNLFLVDLIDRLYVGLVTKKFEFIFTLSRDFSSYDSGLLQRAHMVEIAAAKIPVGITLTKNFVDSYQEFVAQLDDQLAQCRTAIYEPN